MLALHHVRDFLLFIHNTISSDSFIKKYRLLDTAFTRSRILTFPRLMLFLLSLPRRTLSADLSSFLSFLDQGIPCTSKQAFSSVRQNIDPNAFLQLLRDSYQLASFRDTDGLWHGHCVKAIDGTTLRLPDTPENKEEFGTQKNQCKECAMAKASCLQDAALCISNLAAAIKRESDHLLQEENREKNQKHEYQTNRNFLIGQLFEQHLLWIETCGGIERKLVWILERVQRERSPIRPNRKEERKFKMPKKVSQFPSNLRSAR